MTVQLNGQEIPWIEFIKTIYFLLGMLKQLQNMKDQSGLGLVPLNWTMMTGKIICIKLMIMFSYFIIRISKGT